MIDTLRVEYSGFHTGEAFQNALVSEYPTAQFTQRAYAENLPACYTMAKDDVLGTFGTKDSRIGSRFWVEGSLGKFLNGDNCKQLSYAECMEGVDQWLGAVEDRFGEWFIQNADEPMRLRDRATCRRVDFFYQQQVDSSAAVCTALAGAFSEQAKLAQYATSLELAQSREKRARWYDKGYEAKSEDYLNVLRHEEQIRGQNRAGYFLDIARNRAEQEEVRAYMNKRYEHWPEHGIECPDIAALIQEHGAAGAAAAALVLVPSLEQTFRQSLSRPTFYKYKGLATEYKRRKVNVDLRVPEGAWK